MQVKTLQNDQERNVLLVVHDETGQAHDLITDLLNFLKSRLSKEPQDDPIQQSIPDSK